MRVFIATIYIILYLLIFPSATHAVSWDFDDSGVIDLYDFSTLLSQFSQNFDFTHLIEFIPTLDLIPSPTITETPTPTSPPPTGEIGNEKMIVDQTFNFTHGDNGFHPYKVQGEYISGIPKDWTQPDDFYTGEWHLRYEVLSPENQEPGKIQTCIWNMPGFKPENCSKNVPFDDAGTFYAIHSPKDWWKHSGVPLDFSDHKPFLIRAVLRGSGGCNVTRHNVSKPCWDQWPKYEETKFRVTIIMVPEGKSFSGWQNYP